MRDKQEKSHAHDRQHTPADQPGGLLPATGMVGRSQELARPFSTAGPDIVQIDEPYMQARPEKAREYGLDALNRALDGVTGTTAVHICFGYAAVIHERPEGYSFLPEFDGCACNQVSIETAQSGLDCKVLETLPDKTIILGVIDLEDMTVETPEQVAARIRRALPFKDAKQIIVAPDCGMKYLTSDVAAAKLIAMVNGVALFAPSGADDGTPDQEHRDGAVKDASIGF